MRGRWYPAPVVRPPPAFARVAFAGLLAFAASSALPREAGAQYTTARGVFQGGLEYTDNVNFLAMNAPTQVGATDASAPRPRPGFTLNLNPSAIGTYETPRSLTELQYTLQFATVLGIGQQLNYTNRLEVRHRYDATDLTTVNFAVRGTQGQQNMFPEPQPGAATTLIVPGQFTFGTAEVAENLNTRLSPDVVFTQAVGANYFYPIDAKPARANVFAANAALALQYNDDPTNYGITLNAQLTAPGDIECDPYATVNACGGGRTCAVATRRCVIDASMTETARKILEAKANPPTFGGRLGVNIRHDFKNGFNGEIDLGVQQLMRLTDIGGQNWQPAGRMAIRFAEEDIAAGLTFNHGTQLNLDLGTLVLADNLDLVGAVPLDRQTRKWMLQLQASYQRGTIIDNFGALQPGFQVVGGDLALTYRPENWLPNLAFALRYNIRYQVTEPAANGNTVNYNLEALRNAVALNVGFEFPERRPAQ